MDVEPLDDNAQDTTRMAYRNNCEGPDDSCSKARSANAPCPNLAPATGRENPLHLAREEERQEVVVVHIAFGLDGEGL